MSDQLHLGTSESVLIDSCPNCGSSSVEAFCAACGQDQRRSDLTVREWLPDFMAELLSVNGPVVRGTRNLLIAPGQLTRDWLTGRRARYLSPLRIYIVIAAGFFLIWPLFGADPGAFIRGGLPDYYFLPPPMGAGLNATRLERVVATAFPLILLLGSVPLSAWINKGGWA